MNPEALLHEFEQEMTTTRRALERVPMEKAEWSPHPRSSPLGELANHLAGIPTWVARTIPVQSYELDGDYTTATADTTEKLLELFDARVREARGVLRSSTAADLTTTWTLIHNGEATFSAPKSAVLRTFVLSHTVHHRAQLGVYLRLLDVPVPATYGPSADEA